MAMELGDALAWLDSHQNLERMLADTSRPPPDLARMRRLMNILGDPQDSFPVIHLTGTNGKTSTARAVTTLLMAKGLSVGTFTSPHLEAVNERLTANGQPVSDHDLAELLSDLALLEQMLPEGSGAGRPTWFELLAAAAFRWFAERPVDAGVIEVGLGGRWDATNVAQAQVAVVTNVGLDHVEFLGPTVADVAGEKAGIIKAGSTLVLSETDPALAAIFEAEAEAVGAERILLRDRDFEVMSNDLAVGGRLISLRTPAAEYYDVYLALHGRHQAYNFLDAVVAAEEFFGAPIEADLLAEAAAQVRSPGRLEVVGRRPLIVLDGAKNIPGAQAMAAAIDEEFGHVRSRIMVVGMLRGKDPDEMLQALAAPKARHVIACPPPSPRAQPADVVAKAAMLLGTDAEPTGSVGEALDRARELATEDDLILVTGSLYVVGAARTALAQGHRT
ncbi:MAG: dihydrofolate synthase / folylpolyglutamate synthase [Acidimicrobiaceae bacterium]|jgi:dihydrofolate synthase/folylpolyglutamate synthase|nr:dihydrofolate synthase / folylpolyglutamate synthase [Acidimicrobiaceae bacterium]MDQ1421795.1 dihydrofolate synthase / folylpolyglutamate synthase [Acidimicrobiaceae bacterium]MDQ1442509.1 dihydrofolate synthase / folylpolyglutamate synthase [Acidimicrobiaceae bacterium]